MVFLRVCVCIRLNISIFLSLKDILLDCYFENVKIYFMPPIMYFKFDLFDFLHKIHNSQLFSFPIITLNVKNSVKFLTTRNFCALSKITIQIDKNVNYSSKSLSIFLTYSDTKYFFKEWSKKIFSYQAS